MKKTLRKIWILSAAFLAFSFIVTEEKRYDAIYSGIPWFDQNNHEVNAHGACIVRDGELYYLFGEYKTDTINAFSGFSCYSSPDLMNWKFENMVLTIQPDGLLGPNRVGERVKVMKCPSTGEYVMYMHTDDMRYNDPHVGYATCKTINGDYKFQGELMHDGRYIRKWDLGTFQDHDGKGYLLTHEGFIYELSSDYKSVKRLVVSDIAHGGESPAMFRHKGQYFWLFSNKTSWERNDNYYFTATSLEGPWTRKGLFAPEGTLTWNSQCSFVLPVTTGNDTLYMYMGDRWSFPRQGSAATYVWQPVTVTGDGMSIPVFQPGWYIDATDHRWHPYTMKTKPVKSKDIRYQGNWETDNKSKKSKEKGASVSCSFKGKQVGIKAVSNNTSGYARLVVRNSQHKEVLSTIIDFYSLYTCSSRKFLSPLLEHDNYTLDIEVLGVHPAWTDKRRSDYGSTDNWIIIEEVFFR